MIPVVSIVSKSNFGKTTLIEKLLPVLKAKGYKIATVKHDVHGFDLDQPGKDTWRHARAGADVVVIASPTKMAQIRRLERELTLDEVLATISGVDLIITEGYKRGNKPKIEVHRAAAATELLCGPGDQLIALASDVPLELGVPCFDLNDAAGIAGFIVSYFLYPAVKE